MKNKNMLVVNFLVIILVSIILGNIILYLVNKKQTYYRLTNIAVYHLLNDEIKRGGEKLVHTYNLNKDIKIEKNLYYTFMVNNKYLKLREILHDILLNLSNAKLIKKGKRCFIYKFPVKYLIKEELYHYLPKHYTTFKNYIVGNYDSGKKCGKGDYEKCNMYITEKGVLKYNEGYKCE